MVIFYVQPFINHILDLLYEVLREIARSQGKSSRAESGLTEGEVALATSKEGKWFPAVVSWSGDEELWVSPAQ